MGYSSYLAFPHVCFSWECVSGIYPTVDEL